MLPRHATAPQCAATLRRRHRHTSRYGHYAAFLRDDLPPAAAELPFPESAAGYYALSSANDSNASSG